MVSEPKFTEKNAKDSKGKDGGGRSGMLVRDSLSAARVWPILLKVYTVDLSAATYVIVRKS